MSEQIIVARRALVCDLCGQLIPKGCHCRMIRDDTMRYLVYFEHLRCPSSTVPVINNPIQPKQNNSQLMLA